MAKLSNVGPCQWYLKEIPMQQEAMVANLSKLVCPAKLLLRSVAFTKKKLAIALVDNWFSITFKAFYISVGFPLVPMKIFGDSTNKINVLE